MRGPKWLDELRRSRIRLVRVDGERVEVDGRYDQPLPYLCRECGWRHSGKRCPVCAYGLPEDAVRVVDP